MTAAHPALIHDSFHTTRGLTTGEVAHLCRVSTRTVLRWYHSGVLPAVRLDNGHHRVDPEALRTLLLQQGQPVPRRLAAADVVVVLDPGSTSRAHTRRMLVNHTDHTEVLAVADAFDAGAALVRHTPSLLVFDPTTPGMKAEQLCRFVRRTPRLRHMGLVMTAADISRARRRALFEAGVHAAVPKPIRLTDVRSLRRQWLEG